MAIRSLVQCAVRHSARHVPLASFNAPSLAQHVRRRLATEAAGAESGGEYSRSEAAMQDLYMRALEPKPLVL